MSFKCGCCSKQMPPNVPARTVEVQRRPVAYRHPNGKETRGYETSAAAIVCNECATRLVPGTDRDTKVVEVINPYYVAYKPRYDRRDEGDESR